MKTPCYQSNYLMLATLVAMFCLSCEVKHEATDRNETEQVLANQLSDHEIIRESIREHALVSIQMFASAITMLGDEDYDIVEYKKLFSAGAEKVDEAYDRIESIRGMSAADLDQILMELSKEFSKEVEEFERSDFWSGTLQ